MAEKVTELRLKVDDLQSSCCYKKLKKILYKFPHIRDQVYDVKNNIVRINVVCSNPEKIRDKLCRKGGKVIKSIQIVGPPPPLPPKPKDPPKPAPVPAPKPEKPKDPEKPKQPEKPKEVPKPPPAPAPKVPEPVPNPPPPKPVPVPTFPIGVCCRQGYEGYPGGPCFEGCRRTVPPPPCYDYEGYPGGPCFQGCRRTVPPPPCYEGYPRGPCFEGYRRPVPPPPCYDYYGYPYGYGYNRGCYVSRCDQYSATRTHQPAQSCNQSAGHHNLYFHCLPKTNVGIITLWAILSIITYLIYKRL